MKATWAWRQLTDAEADAMLSGDSWINVAVGSQPDDEGLYALTPMDQSLDGGAVATVPSMDIGTVDNDKVELGVVYNTGTGEVIAVVTYLDDAGNYVLSEFFLYGPMPVLGIDSGVAVGVSLGIVGLALLLYWAGRS